jgi:hypothetical protein
MGPRPGTDAQILKSCVETCVLGCDRAERELGERPTYQIEYLRGLRTGAEVALRTGENPARWKGHLEHILNFIAAARSSTFSMRFRTRSAVERRSDHNGWTTRSTSSVSISATGTFPISG